MRPRPSFRSYTGSRAPVAVRLAYIAVLLAPVLAGCGAISIPLGNMLGGERRASPETTGSITPVPAPRVPSEPLAPIRSTAPAATTPPERTVASLLSPAELDSVNATLALALLDEERGATVPWLDQRSGHGGMITPVGSPARRAETVCRAVVVSVQRGRETSMVQGNACRALEGWSLGEVRPFRNPA